MLSPGPGVGLGVQVDVAVGVAVDLWVGAGVRVAVGASGVMVPDEQADRENRAHPTPSMQSKRMICLATRLIVSLASTHPTASQLLQASEPAATGPGNLL